MNKGKNCFFAILVFGLTMAVFNGMSVVLAVSASIGGGIIQGANATSTAITLKWAKLKGINGYYIYRSAGYFWTLVLFRICGSERYRKFPVRENKKVRYNRVSDPRGFYIFNPACDESGDGSNQPVISTGNGNLYGND